MNDEVIRIKLEDNKEAIHELKQDVKDMVSSYDMFNTKMIEKVAVLETKVRQWAVLAVTVSTIIGAILKYKG